MFSFSNSKSVKPYSSTRSANSRTSSILKDGSLISFFADRLFFGFSDSSALAEAVISLIVHLPLQVLAFRGHLALIVYQFDNGHLGVVAGTPAELDDAGVTAVAIIVASTEFVKEPLHC